MRYYLLFVFLLYGVSSNAQMRVAIIGGGMAGVSAAHFITELNLEDVEVTLFEKEAQLGGNAQTIPVIRDADTIFVDIGPQYFAEGPWNDYISLLKVYNLYDKNNFSSFKASFSLYSRGKEIFISPKKGPRGGSFKDLMQFYRFYKASRKVFKHPEKENSQYVNDWVNGLKIKPVFKESVIFPFLAATLGTTVSNIKTTSIRDVVKLYAYRPPMRKGKFIVSNEGMGNLIQQIGKSLMKKGVIVKLNAEVQKLKIYDNTYSLQVKSLQENQFDFIIFAVHPYQAAEIIAGCPQLSQLKDNLHHFDYFTADIALHTDSAYIDAHKESFMNIETINNEVEQSTMNLSQIDERYAGIFKSWVTTEKLGMLRETSKLIEHTQFYHPLISPSFRELTTEMCTIIGQIPDIAIAGGWTEGLETQNSAIIAGKKAAEKLRTLME